MPEVSLPTLSPESGLSSYLQKIKEFPLLSAEREFELARRMRDYGDVSAAHELVTSHLRLVARISKGYKGYGLPLSELISQGNVGLMLAVKRFDPEKGFRLSTYAMWWIRASIQEYILHSWSIVKLGTTAAQKKLFFNLRKVKQRLEVFEEGDMPPETVSQIARDLNVPEQDVTNMNRRIFGQDNSLNVPVQDGSTSEWQDLLVDDVDNQETIYGDREEFSSRRGTLDRALDTLSDRERHIFSERRLMESPMTLKDLSSIYGVSRERVRQIEARAFEKVQKAMLEFEEEKRTINL